MAWTRLRQVNRFLESDAALGRGVTVRSQLLSPRTSVALYGVCLGLAAIVCSTPSAGAEKGGFHVDNIPYGGWKNNLRVSNGDAELIATLDVGPRIISYRLMDGKNVFKEYPDQLGHSGESDWMIRGGHRLWAGPEDLTRIMLSITPRCTLRS